MSKNSHVNTLEVVNGGQPVMSLEEFTLARRKKIFGDAVQKAYAKLYKQGTFKDEGPKQEAIVDEVPLLMLSRGLYPSRQAYRYALRCWAKQKVRFMKAHDRGLLAEHLVPHLQSI